MKEYDVEMGEVHDRSTYKLLSSLDGEVPIPFKHKALAALGAAGCLVASTCVAIGSGMAATELFKHHPNIRASDNTDIPGYIIGANVFAAGICLGGICYCKIKDRYYN